MDWRSWAGVLGARRASATCGLALEAHTSHLVVLGGLTQQRWRVLHSLPQPPVPVIEAPDDAADVIAFEPVLASLQSGPLRSVQGLGTCGISLPSSRCPVAWGEWPVAQEEEVLPDVYLEAASLLGLPPEAVCFDLSCLGQGPSGWRWQWAACARADLRQLRRACRRLRLRLWAVEPPMQAAERAWVHLVEGAEALWSIPPAEWHFAPQPQRQLTASPVPDVASALPLVACGLALAPLLDAARESA